MSEPVKTPKRKISEDVHYSGKNIYLDSSSPVRRSAMELGTPRVENSTKLNRSFMSGKIKLQNNKPSSSLTNVSIIDEDKEMDLTRSKAVERKVVEKSKKSSTSTTNSGESELGKREGDSSGKFERNPSTTKNPIYNSPQRKESPRDPYADKTGIQNGITNQAYIPSSQISINGGSVISLPVYREQYCFYSRWSRLERILLMIILILCLIIACLVSTVGFLANQREIKNCDEVQGLLGFLYCKET